MVLLKMAAMRAVDVCVIGTFSTRTGVEDGDLNSEIGLGIKTPSVLSSPCLLALNYGTLKTLYKNIEMASFKQTREALLESF